MAIHWDGLFFFFFFFFFFLFFFFFFFFFALVNLLGILLDKNAHSPNSNPANPQSRTGQFILERQNQISVMCHWSSMAEWLEIWCLCFGQHFSSNTCPSVFPNLFGYLSIQHHPTPAKQQVIFILILTDPTPIQHPPKSVG